MIISEYSKLNGYYVVTKNGKELEKGRVPFPSKEFSDTWKKFDLNANPIYQQHSEAPYFNCVVYESGDGFTKLELTYLDRF